MKKNQQKSKFNKSHIIVISIIFVALFLRFGWLTNGDMVSDDSLNSFRALGWFDYLGGGNQTTPIQWFDNIPSWAHMSFHDAPPLVFAIQHIFFSMFGDSVFVAKLPFAIAGFLLVILMYFIVRIYKEERIALFSAFLLAISSFAIWISKTGNLEGIEMVLILLSFFFFIRYLKEGRWWQLVMWGVGAAGALLCKYTAIFIVPAGLIYLIVWRRDVFLRRETWFAGLAFLVVLTPLIVYNANMFVARGHFDAALSSMVGMHPEDFKLISSRGVSFDFFGNAMGIVRIFSSTSSPFLFAVIIFSVLYLAIKVIRKKHDPLEGFLLVNILLCFSMLLFVGVAERFVVILVPFFIASSAIFIFGVIEWLKNKHKIFLYFFYVIGIGMCAWETFYAINSNIRITPIGMEKITYSTQHFHSYGFNELDSYMKSTIFPVLPERKSPTQKSEMGKIDVSALSKKEIVFFDETINWFAYVWYFQRYLMYYKLPVISFYNHIKSIPPDADAFDSIRKAGFNGVYYIHSANKEVLDSVKKENTSMRGVELEFAKYLDEKKFKIDEIKNKKGETAFIIYYIPVNL